MDQTGDALLSDDLEKFAACFDLPHEIETFEGRAVYETEESFRALFHEVLRVYASLGVTNIIRYCITAGFKSDSVIEATHEGRLFNGTVLIRQPYVAFSHIVLTENGWKVRRCQYAIADFPAFSRALIRGGHTKNQTEDDHA